MAVMLRLIQMDQEKLHQQLGSPQSLDLPSVTNSSQEIFPLEVLANSRGQGIGRVKQGDVRLPLDKEKTKALKSMHQFSYS